ncbi:MAG: hypothetical protein HY236_14905 [Acidobacteria bacterium]|nr:hypothetical protein [Acidobacteriota bacterium]
MKTDKGDLAPRVGGAWRFTEKSVIRAGYGLYYPTSAAQGMRDAMATNPFNQGRTAGATADAPLSPWPGFAHGFSPLTGGSLRRLSGFPSANALPFDLKEPRIQQYNVTFEQEIGWKTALRVSYLGTRMSRLITGRDLNMIPPNDIPYATTIGDGVTACDPYNGDCDTSDADRARVPFPGLGDYLSSFGNFGHGYSHAFQAEAKRRFSGGFLFNANYTLLSQQVSAVDSANSTLGGTAYNQFKPENDFGRDSFVPRHRFVLYSIYEVPVGKGKKFGSSMPKWAETVVGNWETSWQMFAKSGTGFTPWWGCDNCDPARPGNLASSFIDPLGDFGDAGGGYRPLVAGDPTKRSGNQIFNPDAFDVPTVGADVLDNPKVAKRNLLTGPGTWGVNLGVHKRFRFGERLVADLGADFNNLFNHPLFSPNQDGGDTYSNLGSFSIGVDPNTFKILPITDVTRNPDFGRLLNSYTQEGVDSRRTVRVKLRITF